MAKLHSLLTTNHRPYAAVYADAAARLAATGFERKLGGGIVAFTADDLYKVALQADDNSVWMLSAVTPTWVQVGGPPITLFTGVIAKAPTTLTDAATIATDASLNNNFRVTLGGNRTLGNPTNALDGQILTWEIIQDGTGSRTISLDTKFALGTDLTSITLTTTASKRDFLTVIYNSGEDLFYVRAFVKGY